MLILKNLPERQEATGLPLETEILTVATLGGHATERTLVQINAILEFYL